MDERKTLKEWYEFNKSMFPKNAEFHINIIYDYNSNPICEMEGDMNYIVSLVGHLVLDSFYKVTEYGRMKLNLLYENPDEAGDEFPLT